MDKIEYNVVELSAEEMKEIDGGKSPIEWIGYGVGYFVGLASWMGVGLSRS